MNEQTNTQQVETIPKRLPILMVMGLLKKVTNGVLAIFPCSRNTNTLRAQTWLRPFLREASGQDWTDPSTNSGQAFLNRPDGADRRQLPGRVRPLISSLFNTPLVYCIFLGMGIFSTRLAWPYEAIPEFTGGDLSGTVKVQGTIPHPKRFNLVLFSDPYYCGRVSDGTGWRIAPMPALGKQQELPGAVVFLEHIKRGKAYTSAASVVQTQNCIFLPYTNAAQIGQTLQFENWDPILHKLEVFIASDDGAQAIFKQDLQPHHGNRKSDYLSAAPSGSPQAGPSFRFTAKRAGILVFQCQLHDYMEGWSLVLAHPYFSVTGKQGQFQITDIPPGTYNLTVWHPLGKQKTTVKIEDHQHQDMEVFLTPTSTTTYDEERKESPFGIDLVGDATIVPSVERQIWIQDR